jgi:3'-phosphoadenosine 5'-phosphosulfate sulfotransferase (PAPS reductase)/FAD synthetase
VKTYISWSGGKDSTATVILAHEHNLPIDLIIISLPFFDKSRKIYADHPLHIDFIFNKAIPTFESWGYKVKVVSSEKDYMYWFFKHRGNKCKNPKYNGKMYGWLMGKMCKMNGEKVKPIKDYIKKLDKDGWQSIVGIGINEPQRLERLHSRKNQISLLEQYGYTTDMAKELCRQHGLLSPLYDMGGLQQGCFFCPNSPLREFAKLARDYPQLWNELVELNKLYQKDKTQFVKQGFKYGMSFDKLMEQVELINRQLKLFDEDFTKENYIKACEIVRDLFNKGGAK